MTQKILRAFSRLGSWASTKLEKSSAESKPNSPSDSSNSPILSIALEPDKELEDAASQIVAQTQPHLNEKTRMILILVRSKNESNDDLGTAMCSTVHPALVRMLLMASVAALDQNAFNIERRTVTQSEVGN